jgi:outer membrane receptor protein involved in Fe transport
VAQTLDLTASPPIFVNTNPGDVEIKGIEWNIEWLATEQLFLGFSGSITDAEFVKIKSLPATQIVGDSPDFIPEYNYSVRADYSFDWFDAAPGFFRLNYNRQGPASVALRTGGLLNPVVETESLGFLDAHISVKWESAVIELFARNLLDEDEPTTVPIFGSSSQARPRSIGVRVDYNF